eukprot:CAMPEP_0206275810 /NCGR_PEP_ID=MMETSP0047_2-20121206/35965_1 /ASSEMBLY_ACC=CAM_ASM_000192 /TAXON_ID=195065 /ORGANISM="Chroomonas mesostigmatica_cf, Strain CCMP1168" /LENGTH=123 /DNA_ID=CAMNT_0053705273 /DNA_START=132 /DNA_END=499 /DNA_ORIENTATION=+
MASRSSSMVCRVEGTRAERVSVVSSMHRPRELAVDVGKPQQRLGRGPDGGDEDLCAAEVEAVRVGERAEGGDDGVGVVQGLSHAHKHDIINRGESAERRLAAAEHDCREDLVGGEAAHDAHRA